MLIFESRLTTFEVSDIFEASREIVKISCTLKPKQQNKGKLIQIRDKRCRKKQRSTKSPERLKYTLTLSLKGKIEHLKSNKVKQNKLNLL